MQFPYRTCILPVPYIYAYAMLITLPAAWSLASYFYPVSRKEFPRQVVETMLRGVWEVLQGKIWITYCLLPTI